MTENNGVAHDAGVAEARERVQMYRDGEHEDKADAALAESVLRQELGTADFEDGRRMLQEHISSLSPDRVRQIVAAVRLPAGVNPLSDPTVLRALGEEILGPLPDKIEDAQTEVDAMRKQMATPAWFNDSRAQLRYRRIMQKFPDIPARQSNV